MGLQRVWGPIKHWAPKSVEPQKTQGPRNQGAPDDMGHQKAQGLRKQGAQMAWGPKDQAWSPRKHRALESMGFLKVWFPESVGPLKD